MSAETRSPIGYFNNPNSSCPDWLAIRLAALPPTFDAPHLGRLSSHEIVAVEALLYGASQSDVSDQCGFEAAKVTDLADRVKDYSRIVLDAAEATAAQLDDPLYESESDFVKTAMVLLSYAHDTQRRSNDNSPYATHPYRAMQLYRYALRDEPLSDGEKDLQSVVILLHDAFEDSLPKHGTYLASDRYIISPLIVQDLCARFAYSEDVVSNLMSLTKVRGADGNKITPERYRRGVANNEISAIAKAADVKDNSEIDPKPWPRHGLRALGHHARMVAQYMVTQRILEQRQSSETKQYVRHINRLSPNDFRREVVDKQTAMPNFSTIAVLFRAAVSSHSTSAQLVSVPRPRRSLKLNKT